MLKIEDYQEVIEDHKRLVRELDVLLNGEEGAAQQASLCDIVEQVRRSRDAVIMAEGVEIATGLPPVSWRPVTAADYLEPNPLIDEALEKERRMTASEVRERVMSLNPLRRLVTGDVPEDEIHLRNRSGEIIGKIINLGHEELEAFQTKDGDQAAQAHGGDWLQPTVNPFGHGCCDCGLFHQVEYRIIDDYGNDPTCLNDGLNLQLKFTRDETETARLREHKAEVLPEDMAFIRRYLEEMVEGMNGSISTFCGVNCSSLDKDSLLKIIKLLQHGRLSSARSPFAI